MSFFFVYAVIPGIFRAWLGHQQGSQSYTTLAVTACLTFLSHVG